MEGRLDRKLAEARVQVCMLADHWSWAAGKSIMRQVAAVRDPVVKALPYYIQSHSSLGGALQVDAGRKTHCLAQMY